MKRVLKLFLPAVVLAVVVFGVDAGLKTKSASADWPYGPYVGDCWLYGGQTSSQWQFINGYWQLMPVQQQCQYNYNFYNYQYFPACSGYFTYYNVCGASINYANCGQAYVDAWGNRFTCFGNQYSGFGGLPYYNSGYYNSYYYGGGAFFNLYGSESPYYYYGGNYP